VQRIHAVFFHQGAPALGEGALRTDRDLQALRASAAAHLSPAGHLQVATALDMLAGLEARLDVLRRRLPAAARSLSGARVLAERLYGVGPVTGLAMTCWLGGAGPFSSSRKAVRFAGLDVTVWSSDRKGPPGRLSRQGPEVLRFRPHSPYPGDRCRVSPAVTACGRSGCGAAVASAFGCESGSRATSASDLVAFSHKDKAACRRSYGRRASGVAASCGPSAIWRAERQTRP